MNSLPSVNRVFAVFFALLIASAATLSAAPLTFQTRSRVESSPGSGQWNTIEKPATLDPAKTAIVICDMWDQHWCQGATRRVAEMAPRMNQVVQHARGQGVFIIHCPSDTMKFYADAPQRKLAQAAPKAEPKVPLLNWCHLDKTKEAPLPIDDSDGGCDDWPQCQGGSPWRRQIDRIQIEPGDAITDSAEAYSLMQQRGIENVIVMGVHLNMCVLGRPFAIRQMVAQGKKVLLMRDMTDTMYNSRKRPFVPHAVGTDLMIDHVEKYWCPTVTSADVLGGQPFRFAEDKRANVVFLIGEDEYQTWETLPQFAKTELAWRGLNVSIVQQDSGDKHQFPGLLDSLNEADLLLVSVRRRALPKPQLDLIRAHLAAGKPLIGIRTASHAFAPRKEDANKGDAWAAFDPEVLGGNYAGHHGDGPKTVITAAPGVEADAILRGVNVAELIGNGSLYRVSPLQPEARPLLIGAIEGKTPEPVAWTHVFGAKRAPIFYTSLGHPKDFENASFRRLLLNAILWSVGQPVPPAVAAANAGDAKRFAERWSTAAVPGCWEDTLGLNHDGIAWYRSFVRIPNDWSGKTVTLAVENVDNAHEAFFNGTRIGGAGHFPPDYQNGIESESRYVIPPDRIRPGAWNLIAIRVYDHDGRGGFKGSAPQLGTDQQHLPLQGAWQFRVGDESSWAVFTGDAPPSQGVFTNVVAGPVPAGSQGHVMSSSSQPLPPAQAAQTFKVPEDLEIEQVLAEPLIAQPVFLNFDERGRMWVVQYRQYPAPAGLKVVSKDVFWRAVYDKVPEPPPRGIKGLDKITIHEDTDGDGTFDKHKTFVDGLNIATACVKGRGGLWVLNPPYLLFYPDRDNDDVPDSAPEVCLEGFGLEDTHSVVNSLRWGPDGWLYAAQGSTVTGNVRRPGETNVVYSQGQNIWRYHPETRRYEIFSEGGGNAFGVEIDPAGRIFSGHNGGDTRGFHYAQGAYLRKGFEKHGELANPYAFGYFPHMTGTPGERFTHNFVIYHGGALPERYQGKLFGVEPLQGRIVLSDIQPASTTFVTKDLERVVTSTDTWFRPVDIKVGPDGAIYFCDWYDRQVTHTRNQEGNIDVSNGRIYRLKRKGAKPLAPFDLAASTSSDLAEVTLGHENAWFRQTALRLLADRRDRTAIPALRRNLESHADQLALESLWALNLVQSQPGHTCGLNEEQLLQGLAHPNRQVRIWTARLAGDDRAATPAVVDQMARLAADKGMSEIRAQLACTARRLPARDALRVAAALLTQRGDVNDPRLPLLTWWAIEAHCENDREQVLKLFEDSSLWFQPLVEKHLLERLMRRFAAAGTRADLLTCARLLELAPGREHAGMLMRGFEEAFKGRSLVGLPDPLITAIARHEVGSEVFRLRRGTPEAVTRAVALIRDDQVEKLERLRFTEVLGELHPTAALEPLLALAGREKDLALRKAALAALTGYDDPRVANVVITHFNQFDRETRAMALTLIASRLAWSLAFVQAVETAKIAASDVPLEAVRRLRLHRDEKLANLVAQLWPQSGRPTSEAMQQQIQRVSRVIQDGKGNPYSGQKLFNSACASCHQLFARGGQVGPDLTPYRRSDVETLLLHVINPSAEIREGYENFLLETRDDRSLTGFLVRRDPTMVVLRGPDGQNFSIEPKDIVELRAAGMSLMPEGLLDGLEDQQLRDLFAYLRSTQPLAN